MRAVVYAGPGRMVVRDVPEPRLEEPGDAIVRVALSAICGTDLHALHGIEGIPAGTIMGHEFVGDVVALGPAVAGLRVGDRVMSSDFTACGRCWFCRRGDHWECPERRFFGYGTVFGEALAGAQAELVRVPHAATTLHPLPADCPPEAAIFACDTLASGVAAAERGGVGPGDVVAVVGGGAAGQMASLACQNRGAAAVLVVDPIAARRELASRCGALASDTAAARRVVDELTEGRGADVVVEAVGGPGPLESAFALVRKRGAVVAFGAHRNPTWPLPVARAFADELSLHFVIGDSIRLRDVILSLLRVGVVDPTPVISETVPLDAAPEAYERFAEHATVKVLLEVSLDA